MTWRAATGSLGGGNSYQGELYKDMNEHQHVEAYIGFLIRIHYLATRGRLDVRELSAAIGMPLKYHMPLLCQIASASRRQAQQAGKKIPNWTDAAGFVERVIVAPAFR